MKKKFNWKPVLPHLLALAGFFVLMAIYFTPALEGKVLKQHDIVMAKSMQKEINEYKKDGENILWTNSIFSGMPAYQIWMRYKNNIATYLMRYFKLPFMPQPIGSFFIYFIGFYIFLIVLKIRPELAFIGSIAFAFSSYNLINVEAGHLTKGYAVGFAPLVLSGIILTLRKKYILGMTFTAIALALEIRANHLQITYYLFIMILILMIVEFINVIKEKRYTEFAKQLGLLVIAGLLGIAVNITPLWTTQEYSKYTMRGGSELEEKKVHGDGLEEDYAMAWSYGVRESFTLLIPSFSGGASVQDLGENSKTYNGLIGRGVPAPQAKDYVKQMPTYWGAMRSTSGPIYIGAIILFLFVLGMFLVKSHIKWWLFATSVLALMLAWGENFSFMTDIFFEYFPLYNKFRVPMTLLLIVSLAVPVLSFIVVNELLQGKHSKESIIKALKPSIYIMGGITLFFALFGGSLFQFSGPADQQLESGQNAWLLDFIREDRVRMLRLDAFRSFVYIMLAAGLIYLWAIKKIKVAYFLIGLGIFILADLWGVGKRYFNKDDFHRKNRRTEKVAVQPRPVDQVINQDPDIHYRVMDLTVNPWNDASPAFYHKFIGGYHGAKLSRYQDMIEYHLTPELQLMVNELRGQKGLPGKQLVAYNMLNTKYFIAGAAQNAAIPNPNALGHAWFVNKIDWVQDADEEINALKNIDPAVKAVSDRKFKEQLEGFNFQPDASASIDLVKYHPNKMTYEYKAASGQVAVFPEVYYEKGWNAYIDGEQTPHFRVNYILRALKVPAGEHTVEFVFEPKSYFTGERIALIGSLIMGLLILMTAYYYWKGGSFTVQKATEQQDEGKD